jgi:hypothetical protein|nr:hypothetical protein KUHPSE08_02310 [Staphylococcus epidermidis]
MKLKNKIGDIKYIIFLRVFGFYGGKVASTLNIMSDSFSCGGSIVLRSGSNNKSDILFILYYSVVL